MCMCKILQGYLSEDFLNDPRKINSMPAKDHHQRYFPPSYQVCDSRFKT